MNGLRRWQNGAGVAPSEAADALRCATLYPELEAGEYVLVWTAATLDKAIGTALRLIETLAR